MNHATRTLLYRWHRESTPKDSTQRRRALLASDRRTRVQERRRKLLAKYRIELTRETNALQRRNTELADKLKALNDRVPVYTRVQNDERHFGRIFVIPISFNPDAVVRTLVFSSAERDRSLDLEREFHYLVAFASEKILAALRDAAAEYLGMSGRLQ